MRESERFAALGRFICRGAAWAGKCADQRAGQLRAAAGPGHRLRDEVRAQLETIHAMSLKMHETLQRLSSLDMEMRVAERQAERETLRGQPASVATVKEFEVHRAEEDFDR